MRRMKLLLLRTARALGGFALARRLTRQGVRILCYHGTWRAMDGFAGDSMFIGKQTFRRRLETIRRLGYPVIRLSDAVRALRGEAALPDGSIVITIDDGWYGTYADMLPALREHGMPATLYCDSGTVQSRQAVPHVMARWLRAANGRGPLPEAAERAFAAATDIPAPLASRFAALDRFAAAAGIDPAPYKAARAFDYMLPEELRAAAEAGLDVQLHTHNHTLSDLSASSVKAEVAANRAALAEMLPASAAPLEHFCYPSGVCSAEAGETLASAGVISATTTAQGIARKGMNPYLLPRLLDGEQVSDIEFEAELSGFADFVRGLKAGAR
nr:polysaccharide deacetylase family protein [uncultured Rhodopila sp.]